MRVKISQSRIHGEVTAPPSKSYTHRAVLIASLAMGKSTIRNYLKSDDTERTIMACQALGVEIIRSNDLLFITGVNGRFRPIDHPLKLYLGQSGTTLRLITASCALSDGEVIIDGEDRLRQRPIMELVEVLKKQGIKVKGDILPLKISGGNLKGGSVLVQSDKSSQFISSMLIIAPYAMKDMNLQAVNLRSDPYVDVTIEMMENFGIRVKKNDNRYFVTGGSKYQASNINIEGDWSSASYFLAAAAITGCSITVNNLNPMSLQGDRYILDLLLKMGCDVQKSDNAVYLKGGHLRAIEADLGNYPDLVPTLCVVASNSYGRSKFTNIGHLVYKESNRIDAVVTELRKMGIKVNKSEDEITILGGSAHGTTVNTYNDHRLVMSFSVASLNTSGESIIEQAETVNKSYPAFFADFKKIGAKIKVL